MMQNADTRVPRRPVSSSVNGHGDFPAGLELLQLFRGHRSSITTMAWAQDGQFLASGSNDKTICLWRHPQGKLVKTLQGHKSFVSCVAWSPDNSILASGARDRTVCLWHIHSHAGRPYRKLTGHRDWILCLAWSSQTNTLASGAKDAMILLWDGMSGEMCQRLQGHQEAVTDLAWSADGHTLVSCAEDKMIYLWDRQSGRLLQTLEGHVKSVRRVIWLSGTQTLISCSDDLTIRVWDLASGRQLRVLEGHESPILSLSLSPDQHLLASSSDDGVIRLWRCDTWDALIDWGQKSRVALHGVAFHPQKPILALHDGKSGLGIQTCYVDQKRLLGAARKVNTDHYTNAKVVLVGETSSGKTCIARALLGQSFEPQESTHGMKIWTFAEEVVKQRNGEKIRRETMLWDLAGQSDYRLVHQLFLDETALAVVIFDPTHPENPFAGVRHWEKALFRIVGEDCPKILAAGRVDRGHPTVTIHEIERFQYEHHFLIYIPTSAKTGQGIDNLRTAIIKAIPWDRLPVTSSPRLWKDIREYLLKQRSEGEMLMRLPELRHKFQQKRRHVACTEKDFETVLSHAQAQGLVWRLSFGELVLLKPELLNNYASAVIRSARQHEQGLGCVLEQDVLEARLDFQDMERLPDPVTERALLYTVVELFVNREVALREGEFLVFPSKFNRTSPEYSHPLPREVAYRIAGRIEQIYATLVVRLFYCGAFHLKDLWRNAAEFYDRRGNICGISLHIPEEGYGIFSIFFEESTPLPAKALFLRFIQEHLQKRAMHNSLKRERIYRCQTCGEEVENKRAITLRLQQGKSTITCQYCDKPIQLIDQMEKMFAHPHLLARVQSLEAKAEERKDRAVGVTIAGAKRHLGEFDVFLAHNSEDKSQVEAVARALRAYGINPWFDAWNLPPGRLFQEEIERVLPEIKSIAIFVGPRGFGPWENIEIRVAISQFIKRQLPVIPVALPGVSKIYKLPLFLQEFSWVQFNRKSQYSEALRKLVWGITGKLPPRRKE